MLFTVLEERHTAGPSARSINKLDCEGRAPFELMSEIEQDLQLYVTPASHAGLLTFGASRAASVT